MKRRTEKYPVLTYLFCILAVSALLTGVTFARYKTAVSSDLGTQLAAYGCSYSIEDISTTSIPNVDYWLSGNDGSGAASTPRTMRFTLKNYNAQKASAVDVDGNLRLYLPAEIADNLALQIAEVGGDGGISLYTPEIVLGELLYSNGTYRTYNDESFDTAAFSNYYDAAVDKNGKDEYLSVDGSLGSSQGERKLTAENSDGSGIKMTITAQSMLSQYSVGFHRGEGEADYSSQLFFDLEKEVDYYTIDLYLPSMTFMSADGRRSASYILYMTLTDRIEASELTVNWSDEINRENFDKFITSPPASEAEGYSFNGAKVTGYHFEQSAPYSDGSGNTNVRVSCAYDYNGGFSVSLQHIAPLNPNSALIYAHDMTFGGVNSVTYKPSEADGFSFGATTGHCGTDISCGNGAGIDISSLYVNPFSRKESDGSTTDFGIYEALAKSYDVRYSAVFVQASEEGGQ